jgi:hypothetical protein
MTLLDRFRSQPPQKHPDVAVRLAFLAGLPLADHETIAEMAREDADPKVRRAAVAKLMNPQALATVARADADESVRGAASDMLRDIAVQAFEGVTEADELAALDALTHPRAVAHVVKSAPRASVALRALARVTDARVLGSVARHGVCEEARVAALATLHDQGDAGEILAVALNGEFKETAARAVDWLAARHDLEQVAARARNKNAVKRARVILREMDERAAREAAEQAAAAAEATRVAAEAHAQEVRISMSAMSSDAPVAPSTEDALSDRSRSLTSAAERSAVEPPAEPIAAVSVEAEAAAVDVPHVDPVDPVDIDAHHARLTSVADEASTAASFPDVTQARATLGRLRSEWAQLTALAPAEAATAARFAEADAAISAREAAAKDADVRTRREGLSRMHNLLGRAEQLSVKSDITLKAADRVLRDVRAALAGIPPLPSRADYDDVHGRLKAVQDVLAPKVHELREADEWQKWANVTIQEQLCAKMEALAAVDDPEAIARDVRELQQQWRAAADVPRDKADALWRRFKTAHDTAWAKCEVHFAAEAHARAENLTKKVALCEQAEALKDSTSWIASAEAIKKLQAEWKTVGPVSRGREKAIWDRFRTACDAFFTHRNADLAQRKGVWAENLLKKEALCVRAEALTESTDWDVAAAEIKRLQADWKTIGPVKKSRSETIWQRFRSACDKFFERYGQRHTARAERIAAREAICAELEALAAANEGAEAPADLLSTVRSLRGRWQAEVAARGVDPDRARALDARFTDAIGALAARWPASFAGSDLDPDANRKRMEDLVKKVEGLASSVAGNPAAQADLSPVNKLATMLRDALAANTIGGKADDDARLRAIAEEVRQAQAGWSRLGPVPDAVRRPLADRFHRAVRRVTDRLDAAARSATGGRPPSSARAVGSPRDRDSRPRPQTNRAPEPVATEGR